MKLTKEQKNAIEFRGGNLQLIACAGSGKTEIVARHVAHLLKPGPKALLPKNIIAFTYTDKAAAELKQRIIERCTQELGAITGMAEMFVGTIHAFALDLIKTETPKYLRYGVLDEVQQALFIERHSKSSGLTTTKDVAGKLLRKFIDTDLYIKTLAILRESEPNFKKLKGFSVIDGLEAYRELTDKKSYLDYSSILENAVDVLANEKEVRKRYADRIRHVIVDEYQDVNPIQESLIWLLHDIGASLCVVGDDDQTIYQWRGSHIHNILEFEKRYPKVKQERLEHNFRSSQGIVETARDFIEKNTQRLKKSMKSTDAQEYEEGDVVALSFDSEEQEAKHIVENIKKLHGVAFSEDKVSRGLAYSDMAILLRSVKGSAKPITKALDAARIRYVIVGMNNLFDTPEAEACRQMFYFMTDQIDKLTLLDYWTKAETGSGKAEINKAINKLEEVKKLMAKENVISRAYNIQRVFLDFIENAGIKEERVPDKRGEILFYNLGKFSQLISDFEEIYFVSTPQEKFVTFSGFLQYRADGAYPEGWLDNHYANPDAVRIMTVHQAKGMQWPVVFLPALMKNRFPSKAQGGKKVWHLIPKDSVKDWQRFEGSIEDERRLFYVAMTRSQKYLHMTWAPVTGNRLYQKASEFWDDVLASKWVKRRKQDYSTRKHIQAKPKESISNVILTFSDLKYYFECPYQFKLRVLYGFNPPIDEALGYGKSLHDALAEVHARASRGDIPNEKEVPELIERHLHTPYAYPKLREQLEHAAAKAISGYLRDNKSLFNKIEFFEKDIEINLGDGVSVVGRIDLVRRVDTGETTIVDLKSTKRAQAEDITETQLHIYALGYQELTGRKADYVEIYNLDEGKRKPRSVDKDFMDDVKKNVQKAAKSLRTNDMPVKPNVSRCGNCDYCNMCSAGQEVMAKS